MPPRPVSIRAVGDYYLQPGDTPVDLRPIVASDSGRHVRRITRFIQLALIGVGRCVASADLSRQTAVYLASGSGDIEVASDVMADMLRDGEAIRPLSFVNAVSNSACFHIAKRYDLEAQSCFVSRTQASFQTALQLAWLDMQTGKVSSALVGGVDTVHHPLGLHCRRLHLPPDTPVGEGSHWLWLTEGLRNAPQLRAIEFFSNHDDYRAWLSDMAEDEQATLVCNDALTPRAFYPTQAAAVVSDFLSLSAGCAYSAKAFHLHGWTRRRSI